MKAYIVYEEKEHGEYELHAGYFSKTQADARKGELEGDYNRVYVIPVDIADSGDIEGQLNWLACLEEAGVDNWSGIDYAIQLNQEREDEE